MTDERRYSEDEVEEILDLVTRSSGSGSPNRSAGEGPTLAELQEIGREVGLAPSRIAEAAAALDVRGAALPRGRAFGMPISVGRVVELPRAPTDEEWARLVAELRATFRARGKLGGEGPLREWWNSNLHATVEPAGTGFRLRLGTLKGSAAPLNGMGVMGLVLALVLAVVFALTGRLGDELAMTLLLAAMGGGALAYNALTLPRWADEREAQMEHIARRARQIIGPQSGADDPDADDIVSEEKV